MRLLKHIKGFLALLLVLFFHSCEKDVILDLSNIKGKYLIVEANIDDSSVNQMIRLYRSGSFYDDEKGFPVSNAIVSISDGNNDFIFTESASSSNKGNYYNRELSGYMITGYTYNLTVIDDGKTYTASSILQPVPDIDSVTTRINFLSQLGIINEVLIDIYIHFENLPHRGNYYLINLFINGNIQTFTPNQKTVISDENLENHVSLYIKTVRRNELKSGDKITVEMRSISREQYEFYTDFFSQTELSGNPFAGAPPANIPTNLSEGARGFFQVSSVAIVSEIFKP